MQSIYLNLAHNRRIIVDSFAHHALPQPLSVEVVLHGGRIPRIVRPKVAPAARESAMIMALAMVILVVAAGRVVGRRVRWAGILDGWRWYGEAGAVRWRRLREFHHIHLKLAGRVYNLSGLARVAA